MSRHMVFQNVVILAVALVAAPVWASFAGTDVFLPSVGAKPGVAPAVWYTTMWVHNPNATAANITVYLLERQANPAPLTYTDTVPAGDTKKYGNAVQLMFARETFGALRVTSNVKVIVGSRIYSQSGDLDDSVGQFFAGTPASFAIGAGQTTELLGGYGTLPAADSTFRYNFGFVETTGTGTCQVKVTVKDTTGATQGSKTYAVRQWEQLQKSFKDEFPTLSTSNARLTVEVISGTGKVIAFGSSVANGSQDPATFEMSFRDELLAESSTGGGLTEVNHDSTLTGAGTTSSLLGIADNGVTAGKIASGQVVKSLNGLKDAVTLAPGANITLTPSGNTLTIAATGGSGGSGVPSVNGITSAVTIAGSGGATVNTSGNTITIGTSGSSGGVPSVNGITSAVTIAGTGTASVSTVGGTVTVNGSGLSAVTPGTGLTGSGTPGSPLAIANFGVGTNQLADGAVTSGKVNAAGSTSGQVLTSTGGGASWQTPASGGLAQVTHDGTLAGNGTSGSPLGVAAGGIAGQVLGTNGTGLVWQNDGLTLPYRKSVSVEDEAFEIENTNAYGAGIDVRCDNGEALRAHSQNKTAISANSNDKYALYATNQTASYPAVYGGGNGVGVMGEGYVAGVHGHGTSNSAVAVMGEGWSTLGTTGTLGGTEGVRGDGGATRWGVYGKSGSGSGVVGESGSGYGVAGYTLGSAGGTGVYGDNGGSNTVGHAGYFSGRVTVTGNLSKGGGSFKIDHPLDPEKKYLYHSFVESPDMKNIYDGVVTTDDDGLAVVELPAYFEALNRDFRYQLTVIGRFAQAIVEQEIEGNRFVLRTNLAKVKVSWMVTGIRKDAYANANRIPVEEDKPQAERGTYLHPAAFGQPDEKSVQRVLNPTQGQQPMERLEASSPRRP